MKKAIFLFGIILLGFTTCKKDNEIVDKFPDELIPGQYYCNVSKRNYEGYYDGYNGIAIIMVSKINDFEYEINIDSIYFRNIVDSTNHVPKPPTILIPKLTISISDYDMHSSDFIPIPQAYFTFNKTGEFEYGSFSKDLRFKNQFWLSLFDMVFELYLKCTNPENEYYLEINGTKQL